LVEIVEDAAIERALGETPSRFKSFLAASAVGFAAATMTYRLLRRNNGQETEARASGKEGGGA
jgi:uncharacterized membrane protein